MNNPPAFPVAKMRQGCTPEGAYQEEILGSDGMTLRDYFAAKALNGFISYHNFMDELAKSAGSKEEHFEKLSWWYYRLADAMLAERDKPSMPPVDDSIFEGRLMGK